MIKKLFSYVMTQVFDQVSESENHQVILLLLMQFRCIFNCVFWCFAL